MNDKLSTIDPNQASISTLSSIKKVFSEEDRLPENEHEKAAQAFLLSDGIAYGLANDLAFVKKIPQYIKRIIENKFWECLYVAKGVVTPYYCCYDKGTDSENFRAFITAKRPNGLEADIETIDNALNPDPEVQRLFRTLIYESRQGERTDLVDNSTSGLEVQKSELEDRQKKRLRAANRAAEAISVIEELLDKGLIAIDIAAKLGRNIKDPDNLTADEREYVENRDLIGLRIDEYINSNPIPEDEYKEPVYRRELNRFVKDLLGIKNRSKQVRMDNPKKAAEKLLQFYQGETLKNLINHLQTGLVNEPPQEDIEAEVPQTIPIEANRNGVMPKTDDINTDREVVAEAYQSDEASEKNDENAVEIVTEIVERSRDEVVTSQSPSVLKSEEMHHSEDISTVEDMRLTSFELAERLGIKHNSFCTAASKRKNDFPEWSKKKDPDGISWQKSNEKKGRASLYIPVQPNKENNTKTRKSSF